MKDIILVYLFFLFLGVVNYFENRKKRKNKLGLLGRILKKEGFFFTLKTKKGAFFFIIELIIVTAYILLWNFNIKGYPILLVVIPFLLFFNVFLGENAILIIHKHIPKNRIENIEIKDKGKKIALKVVYTSSKNKKKELKFYFKRDSKQQLQEWKQLMST